MNATISPSAYADELISIEDLDAAIEPVVVTITSSNPLDDQATGLRAIIAEPKPKPSVAPIVNGKVAPSVPTRVTKPAPKPAGGPAAPRASVPAAAGRARVVTVASGKGGVGKTTIAVNLSIALAKRGLRVTLVDADLGTANADLLCGIAPKARLEHVFSPDASNGGRWGDGAPRTLRDIAIAAPGGFRLVPGTAGVARMADLTDAQRRALVAALGEIERDNDVVVIDAGAGVGRDVTAMMDAADLTLVVATPEPTSIADAYALIKCAVAGRNDVAWADVVGPRAVAPGEAPPVALVMNQVSSESEARSVHGRIAAVAKRFLDVDCPMLGWIAHDLRVPEAVRARVPLLMRTPTTVSAASMALLAGSLARQVGLKVSQGVVKPRGGGLSGLVRRLLGN